MRQLLCETGNGTSEGAHFKNLFSDRALGTIAMILAVLTDTILFSRQVIVIQKFAIKQYNRHGVNNHNHLESQG